MRLALLGLTFSFSSRVLPLQASSHEVRGHCHPYSVLGVGISNFNPQNLNVAVSQAFPSAEATAGRAWLFTSAMLVLTMALGQLKAVGFGVGTLANTQNLD